jgi:hypothetical protein
MKKVFATLAQFLLFLALFALGSFLHPFNLHWGLTVTSSNVTRFFVPDGLLIALGVFLAIILVQALRKRTCDTPWTVLSFVVAISIGYAMKFGFVTRDLL